MVNTYDNRGKGDADSGVIEEERHESHDDGTCSSFEDVVASEEGVSVEEPSCGEEEAGEIIAQLRLEVQENYNKYLRAVAELENFRKRSIKERAEAAKYAGENIARDLLEVIDTLEIALNQTNTDGTTIIDGVRLVLERFNSILGNHSIRGESALGEMFDPSRHEALATVPGSGAREGEIIEEFKKAYYFKDKLLRPGQVVVAAAETA
ncbi:MAG: nucleotide exchange factor GrpE [bacterium]|nr:nucleotide exchange factor GrpE [bacterium]